MKAILVLVVLLFAFPVYAQRGKLPTPPPAPPVKAECRCDLGEQCCCEGTCQCRYTYAMARQRALRGKKPLVVFVNTPVRGVPGAVCVWVATFEGDNSPRIVVSVYQGGELKRHRLDGAWSLPAAATDAKIQRWIEYRPAAASVSSAMATVAAC